MLNILWFWELPSSWTESTTYQRKKKKKTKLNLVLKIKWMKMITKTFVCCIISKSTWAQHHTYAVTHNFDCECEPNVRPLCHCCPRHIVAFRCWFKRSAGGVSVLRRAEGCPTQPLLLPRLHLRIQNSWSSADDPRTRSAPCLYLVCQETGDRPYC